MPETILRWLRHRDNWSPRPRSGSRTGAGARPRSESQDPAPGSESQQLASGAGLWLQVGLASSPIGLLKSCLLPQSELTTEYKFKRLSHLSQVMFITFPCDVCTMKPVIKVTPKSRELWAGRAVLGEAPRPPRRFKIRTDSNL